MNQNMKQQMLVQVNKIQELFQNSCKRIISLINSDEVTVIQTNQVAKCLNRIQKFLESNQQSLQPQKKQIFVKQEPFNDTDYEIINNYLLIITQVNFESLKKLGDELWEKIEKIANQIKVDEKTEHFDNDGYYGYKMNGIRNGLGILITQKGLVFGYFMGGEINPSIKFFSAYQQPKVTIAIVGIEQEIINRINKFFEIYPNLSKYKTFQNDQFIKQFQQSVFNSNNQYITILDYYIGQAKQVSEKFSHKHGYGLYIDLDLPTFAYGFWQDNKLKDGLLISQENNQYFKHSGQMGDHHQNSIKY